jgi:hypothetical protein
LEAVAGETPAFPGRALLPKGNKCAAFGNKSTYPALFRFVGVFEVADF